MSPAFDDALADPNFDQAAWSRTSDAGKTTRIVVPSPGVLSTSTLPPWRSTRFLTSPMPVSDTEITTDPSVAPMVFEIAAESPNSYADARSPVHPGNAG